MRLEELHPAPGSKRPPKRVGRGTGSGQGKTCGRGTKGQKARSGRKPRAGFEGGQMPLQRRIPKRGFKSLKEKKDVPVNIEALNRFEEGTEITPELLHRSGLIKRNESPKLLSKGEIKVSLVIKGCRASKAAYKKIVAKGGKIL
ncbi:TPA: 50S ribosomal protein L15 [bacterium]|nr:50S ribosomal protein L15 [bacterium]